ncbi:MAG TPA: L-threonylcarbamoyladenylate synthase [Patescibacteria group bacterium]|nr:L-threonylcarbamoyladenylate synthase [Patescibacteria group bacterium]
MLLPINPSQPEINKIQHIVEILRTGGVIIYPTDTIYGLGCDIFNKKAVDRIYKIKKRQKNKFFSFICADFKQVGEFAVCSNSAFRIMKRVLPGPFTFILSASHKAPRSVIEHKRRTVGIRIPDHAICLEMVRVLGNPIVTTSVNYAGEDVMNDPVFMEREFGRSVDAVIDAGVLPIEPSTIVDATDDEISIVRQGKGHLDMGPSPNAISAETR